MHVVFFGFVLLDALLLFLLVSLRGRGHWALKAFMIVVVLGFNFFVWSARDTGLGWPIEKPIPPLAQFVSCVVQEPEPGTKQHGVIYLWMIPLQAKHGIVGYQSSAAEPRAYKEPYRRDLHKSCDYAAKETSQGIPVGIKKVNAKSKIDNRPGRYVPYLLPTPQPLEKTRQ